MRKKICFVVNVEYVVNHFLINHLRSLSKIYDVTLVGNFDRLSTLEEKGIVVKTHKIPFKRGLSLYGDMLTFFMLFLFMLTNRFDCIHSITPKIGFFTAILGYALRFKKRIHMFTGQVWLHDKGIRACVLKLADRVTGALTTDCLVDSHSQLTFLHDQGIFHKGKGKVLGAGSISGVDTHKFKFNQDKRRVIRQQLAIPDDALCLVFIARLSEVKGIYDLIEALERIANPAIYLIVVGPDEENVVGRVVDEFPGLLNNIKFVGYSFTPEHFLSAGDVLTLPSHREGFGSVIIEAASVGIPAMGSDIYGINDAIASDKSGLLHPVRDIDAIAACINRLNADPVLRQSLGDFAYQRAIKDFNADSVTSSWVKFYHDILEQ